MTDEQSRTYDVSRNRVACSELDVAIILALARGMQSKEIAAFVGRSKGSVETHIRLLLARFDARSRAHLVTLAISSKMIDVEVILSDTVRDDLPSNPPYRSLREMGTRHSENDA